jgi:uncharacterized protein
MKEMSPQISIDLDAVSAFCRRHRIKRLALFGSVLRDDFSPDSDVDVLVEFQPGHVPGLDFASMEREFSRLLQGRRVDMVTPKFLNARIRDQILASAEPLYVAAHAAGPSARTLMQKPIGLSLTWRTGDRSWQMRARVRREGSHSCWEPSGTD